MSPTEFNELMTQLMNLLDKGFICLSISPWGATVLYVNKKDAYLKKCIEYHLLKKVTTKNKYPIMRINGLFDKFQGESLFSIIYISFGYPQLRVIGVDIPQMTLQKRYGHFEFIYIFVGLKKANSFPGPYE